MGDDHDPDPVNARGWHWCGSGRYVCSRPRPPQGREGDPVVPAGHHREAGREGCQCDGASSDLRARSEGFAAPPHRPGVRLVVEGEYEHALDDEPVKKYKAGDTFYEPSGSVHRVARNPSGKTRTRLLAVVLHSRDTKETTVPEKGKE